MNHIKKFSCTVNTDCCGYDAGNPAEGYLCISGICLQSTSCNHNCQISSTPLNYGCLVGGTTFCCQETVGNPPVSFGEDKNIITY